MSKQAPSGPSSFEQQIALQMSAGQFDGGGAQNSGGYGTASTIGGDGAEGSLKKLGGDISLATPPLGPIPASGLEDLNFFDQLTGNLAPAKLNEQTGAFDIGGMNEAGNIALHNFAGEYKQDISNALTPSKKQQRE